MADMSLKNSAVGSFGGSVGKAGSTSPFANIQNEKGGQEIAGDFSKALQDQLKSSVGAEALGAGSKLQFSSHAVERMQTRGIRFSQERLDEIANAVSMAALKGAKQTLVLAGESALIVDPKSNKVVTVMDKAGMKENVFTNIDSTVVL